MNQTREHASPPTSPSSQHSDLAAWGWAYPREAAEVLFNNADRLPDCRADGDAVRVYIAARIAEGTPLHLLGSQAAVKPAETTGKLYEAFARFVCEWPQLKGELCLRS